MDGGRLLAVMGLVRNARAGGFCPACRVLMKAREARPELAKPMVAALVVLAVAGGLGGHDPPSHAMSGMYMASPTRLRRDLGRIGRR